MINIYLSFKKDIFNFFEKSNNIFKDKYNINFDSSLKDSDIVFYLSNIGIKDLFKDSNHNLNSKYDLNKDEKNIEYFINLNKKIIIYFRQDGGTIIPFLNNLIKQYPNNILFIINDFLLKKEQYYQLCSNSHYKYKISKIYPKKNKEIIYTKYYNNLDKYFCFTIPYSQKTSYGILTNQWKPYRKFICEKKKKEFDIFYVKHYRGDTYNSIYRKKTLDQLNKINKDNKYKLYTQECSKIDFYDNLLKSKIMISVWGIGESLIDDYFCVHNDVIVLKVCTSHLKDFYNLFEKDNLFHFFNIDFSDLEEKINMILNNYEYYYKLHNEKRQKIINKYNEEYHIKILANKINLSYKN